MFKALTVRRFLIAVEVASALIDPERADSQCVKSLDFNSYFRLARHSGAIEDVASFRQSSECDCPTCGLPHLFVFQSAPEDRLASERDIKAPEKQNERSQQCDHGAPSVPLVEISGGEVPRVNRMKKKAAAATSPTLTSTARNISTNRTVKVKSSTVVCAFSSSMINPMPTSPNLGRRNSPVMTDKMAK